MDEATALRRVLKGIVKSERMVAEEEDEEAFDVDDFIVGLLITNFFENRPSLDGS